LQGAAEGEWPLSTFTARDQEASARWGLNQRGCLLDGLVHGHNILRRHVRQDVVYLREDEPAPREAVSKLAFSGANRREGEERREQGARRG
jgi:hypothetical protein